MCTRFFIHCFNCCEVLCGFIIVDLFFAHIRVLISLQRLLQIFISHLKFKSHLLICAYFNNWRFPCNASVCNILVVDSKQKVVNCSCQVCVINILVDIFCKTMAAGIHYIYVTLSEIEYDILSLENTGIAWIISVYMYIVIEMFVNISVWQ